MTEDVKEDVEENVKDDRPECGKACPECGAVKKPTYTCGSASPRCWASPSGVDVKISIDGKVCGNVCGISFCGKDPYTVKASMIFVLTKDAPVLIDNKSTVCLDIDTEFGHWGSITIGSIRNVEFGLGISIDDITIDYTYKFDAKVTYEK